MELRGIVPAIVPAPPPEPFAVQVIIVDWLYREVDGLAEIKMPVLQHIAGAPIEGSCRQMRRREFITLVGGSTVIWPLAARAQPGKLLTIGLLGDNAAAWSSWTAAFEQRLHELGWIEGQTIAIEYRWSEGR